MAGPNYYRYGTGSALMEGAIGVYEAFEQGKRNAIDRENDRISLERNKILLANEREEQLANKKIDASNKFVSMGFVDMQNPQKTNPDNIRAALIAGDVMAHDSIITMINAAPEIFNSPKGTVINSMEMVMAVRDKDNEIIYSGSPEDPNTLATIKKYKADGFTPITGYAFYGNNADGTEAVLTEDASSDGDSPVMIMGLEETIKNIDHHYKVNIFDGSTQEAALFTFHNNLINNSESKTERAVAEHELNVLRSNKDKAGKINKVINYFMDNGMPDAARQISAAAVKFADDPVKFNELLNKVYDSVDEKIKEGNKLRISASGQAANLFNAYNNAKKTNDDVRVKNIGNKLADAIVTANPKNDSSAAYVAAKQAVNELASGLIADAIEDGNVDKKLVKKYERLLKTSQEKERPKEVIQRPGLLGGRQVIPAVTEATIDKQLAELEEVKTQIVDGYIENNPAMGEKYALAKQGLTNAKSLILADTSIQDFAAEDMLDRVLAGEIVFSNMEIQAHKNFLDANEITNIEETIERLNQTERKRNLAMLMYLNREDPVTARAIQDELIQLDTFGETTSDLEMEKIRAQRDKATTDELIAIREERRKISDRTLDFFIDKPKVRESYEKGITALDTLGDTMANANVFLPDFDGGGDEGYDPKVMRDDVGPALRALHKVIKATDSPNDPVAKQAAAQEVAMFSRAIRLMALGDLEGEFLRIPYTQGIGPLFGVDFLDIGTNENFEANYIDDQAQTVIPSFKNGRLVEFVVVSGQDGQSQVSRKVSFKEARNQLNMSVAQLNRIALSIAQLNPQNQQYMNLPQ